MIQRQIDQFIEMSKKTLESFLSKERKNILVVAYYSTYRKHYGALLNRLKEKYNVITVVERILNDAFENSGHYNLHFPWRIIEGGQTYYLNMDVDGIDLILTADQVGYEEGRIDRTFLSTKAKRVYFPHSVIEQTGASDVVDYILVPSKIAMESFREVLKDSKVKLLESGYPKLDEAINSYAYQDSNTITYAPSLRYVNGDNASLNLFAGFENAMVESLLELTDYKISYRAHPMNFQNHHGFYNLVKSCWQNEVRVCFDEQLGNDFCNFSDFLVTDFSTTAFTYSFTTLRPSLFFTPLRLNAYLAKYIPDISGMETMICKKSDLRKRIMALDFNRDYSRIKKFRDENVYNIGNSVGIIEEQIAAILNGDL